MLLWLWVYIFVLFRLIQKHSFNLLCVLDLFFRMLAVNSVSDLYKKKKVMFFTMESCDHVFYS